MDYQVLNDKIESLLDMEVELRNTQDKIKDQDAYGRIETVYDNLFKIANELYNEFLDEVVKKLDSIANNLKEFTWKNYQYSTGYHVNIKSSIIASQPDYEFIIDVAFQDWQLKLKDLGLEDWNISTNGRSGGWLCVLSERQLSKELPILDEITQGKLLSATKDDFIGILDFISHYKMKDLIKELNNFRIKSKKLSEFEGYLNNYIEHKEKYYQAKEQAPQVIKEKLENIDTENLSGVEHQLEEIVTHLKNKNYLELT